MPDRTRGRPLRTSTALPYRRNLRMYLPRIRRFRYRSPPALLVLVLFSLPPATPLAPPWPFDWRPGWVPGDPIEDTVLDAWAMPSHPGLYVAIDPVTHRPVAPSHEQRAAFQRAFDLNELLAPTAPVRVEALPHGGEIAHLNGAFQSFSVARRDASGHYVNDCAPDAKGALQILSTPV